MNRNLNPVQFLSVKEALSLHSRDYGGTVGEHTDEVREHEKYAAVRDSMRDTGQTTPIRVEGNDLHGGHHRIAAAQELGWESVSADVKYRLCSSAAATHSAMNSARLSG
jgi:hypothetical protein